ncbi:hypothetical protein QBC38DRAFT_414506 [Podospora fimiseda]|uniref:Clr5 domain-containing protein n=1 Tax=Podospora fimiseda TaxID=252190 RepID=A0AAN7GWF2_9PEZI|nr:hypothetical protein QBC38DRAFT_414506 [Podospora fimiseda]
MDPRDFLDQLQFHDTSLWAGTSSYSLPNPSSVFTNTFHSDVTPSLSLSTEKDEPVQEPSHSSGPPKARSRRSKYGNLDWEKHKSELKQLYLDDNLTQPEVLGIMQMQHSFLASAKLYKEKFKEWGWEKNLPSGHARFMKLKDEERRREEGKSTLFHYGGREYTAERAAKTLSRAKTVVPETDDIEIKVETPLGITYYTPPPELEEPPSPEPGLSGEDTFINSQPQPEYTEPIPNHKPTNNHVPGLYLRWQGLTRTDLLAMNNSAKSHITKGDRATAESLLRKVLEGYRYLLGPTNHDTIQASYSLATFFADDDRMLEADQLLEEISHYHITHLGLAHKTTYRHVLHTAELLNSWNRKEDAWAFLSKFDTLTTPPAQPKPDIDEMSISELKTLVTNDNSQGTLDLALGVAKCHIATNDTSVESLLLAIIKQSANNQTLLIQHFKARADLLRLYADLGRGKHTPQAQKYDESHVVFRKTLWKLELNDLDWWYRDKFRALEFIEACMQLGVGLLKGNFPIWAMEVFDKIERKAAVVFGRGDERYLWVCVKIGIVYQREHAGVSWEVARRWFEHALCTAVMAGWREEDGVVRSLRRGLESEWFEYLSGEEWDFRGGIGGRGRFSWRYLD